MLTTFNKRRVNPYKENTLIKCGPYLEWEPIFTIAKHKNCNKSLQFLFIQKRQISKENVHI